MNKIQTLGLLEELQDASDNVAGMCRSRALVNNDPIFASIAELADALSDIACAVTETALLIEE